MAKIVIFHAVLYLFYFMDERGKLLLTYYCFVEKYNFKGNNKVTRPLILKRSLDSQEAVREVVCRLVNSP